jgi:hypothetical protein
MVHKDEGEAVGYHIHHPLESVASVAEPKTHLQELVQAERRDDGGLGVIPGMQGVALARSTLLKMRHLDIFATKSIIFDNGMSLGL